MRSMACGEALAIILEMSHGAKLGKLVPICTAILYPSCQEAGGLPKTAQILYS